MVTTTALATQAIILLQSYIESMGYRPIIHFELEGCVAHPNTNKSIAIDYAQINYQLEKLGIDGELVPEYWQNQWEYVSKFNGQSPFKEAKNLALAIDKLPQLFARQGIKKTLIKPVVWSGDHGKLALGSKNIFAVGSRAVHIPNAVQINVSATDEKSENIIPKNSFGEYLQQCFIETSLANSLLYLPEEEAFERLALKSRYGLVDELCSPTDISGGHQGSIALYKKIGKHNQQLGIEPVLFDAQHQAVLTTHNWQKTARVEHRLGASSLHYNPFVNIAFALANLVQALEVYKQGLCQQQLKGDISAQALPNSLFDVGNSRGAISLFCENTWFSDLINHIESIVSKSPLSINYESTGPLGNKLKQSILAGYQHNVLQII
ncbi:hypothetical protein AAD001_07285 [Colwelliaceae bacterium 6471]